MAKVHTLLGSHGGRFWTAVKPGWADILVEPAAKVFVWRILDFAAAWEISALSKKCHTFVILATYPTRIEQKFPPRKSLASAYGSRAGKSVRAQGHNRARMVMKQVGKSTGWQR